MEIVLAALIAAIPATLAAAGAWRSTVKMNKTTNGTTSGEYVEQSHALLMNVAQAQRDMGKQLENHIVDKRLHNASVRN
jgi:hypothetical protein